MQLRIDKIQEKKKELKKVQRNHCFVCHKFIEGKKRYKIDRVFDKRQTPICDNCYQTLQMIRRVIFINELDEKKTVLWISEKQPTRFKKEKKR